MGAMLYDDITPTIGRTPVVRVRRVASLGLPSHIELYVKIEAATRVDQ